MDDKKINIFKSKQVETWGDEKQMGIKEIPVEEFSKEVSVFYENITEVFSTLSNEKNGFKLEEITINAEVNASGKIGFLGTGAEVGVKGSISFKLKKK